MGRPTALLVWQPDPPQSHELRLLAAPACCILQYIGVMHAEKTIGLSFRVTPKTKRLLEAAAQHERRSLTNMFEVLVEDFCARNAIDDTNNTSSDEGTPGRSKK